MREKREKVEHLGSKTRKNGHVSMPSQRMHHSKSTISKSTNASYGPLMKPDTCLSRYERWSSWKNV